MPDTLAQKVRAKFPGTYDDLSDQDLEAKVVAKYPGVYDDVPRTASDAGRPAMNFATVNGERVPIEDGPLDLVKGAAHNLNPLPALDAMGRAVVHGARALVMGPSDAERNPERVKNDMATAAAPVEGIIRAQAEPFDKMVKAYRSGNYVEAARHALGWAIPLIGPTIDQAGDRFSEGRPWRGTGEALGIAGSVLAPEMLKLMPSPKASASVPRLTPQESAAVAFADQRGVPLDAATRTGSRSARAMQKRVANSIGGEGTAERMVHSQQEALTRVGGELADQAHPSPVTAEQAGAALRKSTKDLIQSLDSSADYAYNELRHEAAGVPVDLRQVKSALTPIYQRMKRESELVPLQGDRARALVALDRLMAGPDMESVAIVDGALSDLKAMARGAVMPELRTKGQGTAAAAVQALEGQLQEAVKRAGPKAVKLLEQGRTAVKTKAVVADILDTIKEEPVKAFNDATARQDTNIAKLRDLQQVAPEVMPQVARAWLDDSLATAGESGRFEHADRLYANWQRLGPETKRVLFPDPAHRAALDHFFLLAKRVAENPNPSGTAHVNNAFNWASAVLSLPASKLLYTPGGARIVAKVLKMPQALKTPAPLAGATRSAAQKAAWAQVAAAARGAGGDLKGAPAAAEDQEPSGSPQ